MDTIKKIILLKVAAGTITTAFALGIVTGSVLTVRFIEKHQISIIKVEKAKG